MLKKFNPAKFAQSEKWFRAFMIATGVCLLVYVLNILLAEINPGNIWGLTYGTASSLLMAGVALLGIRRRTMKFNWGKSHTWAQFHFYAGTLCLLLMFMHVGFKLPSGPLNWWLWGLTIWVSLSGFVGIFFQKWIPRILASGLSIEAVYERIPELIKEIKTKSEELIQKSTAPIRDFYIKNIAASLATPQTRLIYYLDITGGIQAQVKQFNYLRDVLSSQEKESLTELESLYKKKLELDAHYTLQKALRWWLYTHVPLSLILIFLVCLHLYAVFVY